MTPEKKPPIPKEESSSEPQKNKPEKTKIVIAAVDIEQEARDAAEARMTADKKELSGFGGFFKKVWKHNIMHDYYRQKELAKVRREIKDSGNIFSEEKGDQIDHNNAMKAIVERFSSEYEAEMVHTAAGEKKKDLKGENSEDEAFKSKIQGLIGRYAKGEIDEEQFLQEKDSFLNTDAANIRDEKGEKMASKNSLYADNLLEVARQVKQKFDSDKSNNDLDLDFDITFGKAKTGVRTEAGLDRVDKVIDKIRSTLPGGLLVNEASLALIVSAAYSVATKGAISSAQRFSKLLGPLGFVASAGVGGMVAGIKERKRLKEERAQHSREMAKGKVFDKDADRRKEMEEYRHETKGANEMSENLEKSLEALKNGNISKESLTSILAHFNEIESRVSFSDRKAIDLIQYSDAKKIEQERMRMDLARAESKVFLKKLARGEVEGFDKNNASFLKDEASLERYLEEIREKRIEETFLKEKNEKDEAYFKMSEKKVARAFVKGTLVGAGIGLAAQEALSALGISGNEGLISPKEAHASDQAQEAAKHFTPLEYLRRWYMNDLPRMNGSELHESVIGNHHFKLPPGADFQQNSDGSYDLLRNGNPIARGLTLDEHGGLTDEARNALHQEGIFTGTSVNKVDASNAKEYLSHHKDAHSIKRDLWYDNDTPKPTFDKNELKLHMGGVKGSGVDKAGNFVFNIKQMLPGGSFHDKFSVDAQEAMQSGKLKILLSLSRETQGQVFEVPIDANGNAIIDPESEIGKMFFENNNGQAIFKGKFAEVAEMMDQNDGKNLPEHVKIISTHVGAGTLPEDVSITILDIPAENEVDWPAAVPILGRRPLEKTTSNDVYVAGYFQEDSKNRSFYSERQSESLKKSDAELDSYDEIDSYFKRQPSEWLEKVKDLAGQIKEPMNPNCRVAICIPAAGHQEGKNIYKTLELYKVQHKKDGSILDKKSYEIIVFVNYPKDKEQDETLSEIERFKKDNPNVPVKVLHKQIEREEATIGNIRKYVNDVALMRQYQRGRGAKDLIMISNDADCSGMSQEYIANFIDKFDSNTRADAVLGKVDWDTEAYMKSPLIHIGTRLFQYIDAIYRHHKTKTKKGVGSSGANFAFKSSIYAAIGGYIESDRIAEDKHLGEMIKYARKNTAFYPIEYGGAGTGIVTNARRAVDALKKGLSPAEQWSTNFGPDDTLRESEWNLAESEDILEKLDDKKYQEQIMIVLQKFINRTLRIYELSPKSWEAKKALKFLGIKNYEIKHNSDTKRDEIVFNDVTQLSKLIAGLKEYQLRNKK